MKAGEVSCPKSSLAPAESMVCTASYDITAVDVGNYLVRVSLAILLSPAFASETNVILTRTVHVQRDPIHGSGVRRS